KKYWDVIADFTQAEHPTQLNDSMGIVTGNLNNKGNDRKYPTKRSGSASSSASTSGASAASGAAAAPSAASGEFKAQTVFDVLSKRIGTEGPALVSKVNGVFEFDIGGAGGKRQSWTVDLKSSSPSVKLGK